MVFIVANNHNCLRCGESFQSYANEQTLCFECAGEENDFDYDDGWFENNDENGNG